MVIAEQRLEFNTFSFFCFSFVGNNPASLTHLDTFRPDFELTQRNTYAHHPQRVMRFSSAWAFLRVPWCLPRAPWQPNDISREGFRGHRGINGNTGCSPWAVPQPQVSPPGSSPKALRQAGTFTPLPDTGHWLSCCSLASV